MAYTSRIIGVLEETHDTRSIRFTKPVGFEYRPGHYCIFEHTEGSEIIRRSYSLSSSPTEPFLQIGIKHIPNGKMSTYLTGLHIGDTLTFNGPVGKFLFDDGITDVVFIAGGSGISAFRSMIKYAFDKKLSTNMTLIYGSRSPRDIILRDYIEELNREHSNFNIFITIDKQDPEWHFHVGFIDASFILEATKGNVQKKIYFLCGPPIMITNVKNALLTLGVAEDNIRLDAWG